MSENNELDRGTSRKADDELDTKEIVKKSYLLS